MCRSVIITAKFPVGLQIKIHDLRSVSVKVFRIEKPSYLMYIKFLG